MPRLNKKRKAAVLRERAAKVRRTLIDPLAWTFENPWRSDVCRPSESDTPSDSEHEPDSCSGEESDCEPNPGENVSENPSGTSGSDDKSLETTVPYLSTTKIADKQYIESLDQFDSSLSSSPGLQETPSLILVSEIPKSCVKTKRGEKDREDCNTILCSERALANNYEFFRKGGSIKLSQTKTTIIELPPMHADEYLDPTQACGCAACKKCREYYPAPLDLQSNPTINVHGNKGVFADAPGQNGISNDVYENFIQPKPSSRFKNIQGFVRSSSTTPAKRLQAIDTNEYYGIEIPHWKQLEGRRIIDYDYCVKWL